MLGPWILSILMCALSAIYCASLAAQGGSRNISQQQLATIKAAVNQANTLDYQGSTDIAFEKTFVINSPLLQMNRVVQFNPDKRVDQQWQLIQNDGTAATEIQRSEYREKTVPDYQRQQHKQKQQGLLHPLLPYIDWSSILFKETKPHSQVFSFALKNREDAENLSGEFTLQKNSEGDIWLANVAIVSLEPFKKSWFGPSIDYQTRYQFTQVAFSSTLKPSVLLESMSENIRFDFGVKTIASSRQEKYRNFEMSHDVGGKNKTQDF